MTFGTKATVSESSAVACRAVVAVFLTFLVAGISPQVAEAYSLKTFREVAPVIAERVSEQYGSMIDIAALLQDYDENMILAVMVVESEGKTSAISHKGAVGLMQLMPSTAKALGVKDPTEPFQNILAGTKYLKELERVYKFTREEALVAYNMGPTRARRWLTEYQPTDSLYVQKVLHVYGYLAERERRLKMAMPDESTQIAATHILTKPKPLSLYESPSPLQNFRREEVTEKEL